MVNRENRRYGRVTVEKGVRVSLRSIGSEVSYDMETFNISDTGFFLKFEKPGRFPFGPSSIMEVWLELEKDNTVFFNGKMTRVVYPEEAITPDIEPGIAIRIIQIDKGEENLLREFIRKKALENEANGSGHRPDTPDTRETITAKKTRRKKAKTKKVQAKKVISISKEKGSPAKAGAETKKNVG